MKKIRHSRLPITLESSDKLTFDFLKAITLDFERYGWDRWKDEYNNWFRPTKPNPKQLELFKEK
jgi:hypothetical protein